MPRKSKGKAKVERPTRTGKGTRPTRTGALTNLAGADRPTRTAGLKRGQATGKPRKDEPTLTAATASHYVKMLHAGIDGVRALRYFAPDYFDACKPDALHGWLQRWSRSHTVLAAQRALCGGAWETLDPDRRLTIALDKHFAELAYFLVDSNYRSAEGDTLKKIGDARQAIMAKITADKGGDPDSPFNAYLRDVLAGKIAFDKPPTLAGVALPIVDRPTRTES